LTVLIAVVTDACLKMKYFKKTYIYCEVN